CMVSFSEFQKIDLRIAEIVSIEDIAGKDKLYKLTIEIGEEKPRTLVAGLKPYYSKEQLKGKQIVVVANLDPRPLAGIVSQGMLLAVKNKKEKFSLVTIEENAEPGEKIE
ncbi:MAG TPA: methionine--tRNA ligase, partial [archaeon]|nr:methionine--tRNA ligase [archaeon]